MAAGKKKSIMVSDTHQVMEMNGTVYFGLVIKGGFECVKSNSMMSLDKPVDNDTMRRFLKEQHRGGLINIQVTDAVQIAMRQINSRELITWDHLNNLFDHAVENAEAEMQIKAFEELCLGK